MNEVVDINGTPYRYTTGDNTPWSSHSVLSLNLTVARARGDVDSGRVFEVLASGDGELFNPLVHNGNIPKNDRHRGGRHFRLVKCSSDCYRSYTTFLRSKNRTHFVVAQRRLLDGYS